MLSSLRVGAFLVASPFFGSRMVPLTVRIVFSVALGIGIMSQVEFPNLDILMGASLLPIVFQEIFVGLAPLPSSFDWFIEEAEAPLLSAALADYLCKGRSWRMCREQVMSAYPVSKKQRRERFEAVMAGLKDYTAEELDGELLDLHATNKLLNTNNLQGADGFLENLRQRG